MRQKKNPDTCRSDGDYIHLYGVDSLFEAFDVVGAVLYFTTQVDRRNNTVSQVTVYVPSMMVAPFASVLSLFWK